MSPEVVSRKLSRMTQYLALGAGLRNILVHDYEEIDYPLLHRILPRILDDLSRFIEECAPYGA